MNSCAKEGVLMLKCSTAQCDFQIMNGHSWTSGKVSSEFIHGRRSSLNVINNFKHFNALRISVTSVSFTPVAPFTNMD